MVKTYQWYDEPGNVIGYFFSMSSKVTKKIHGLFSVNSHFVGYNFYKMYEDIK